jgi:hypothetical protein
VISLSLCVAALVASFALGRRSLVAGIGAVLTVGYAYGLARANFLDGYSHFMFDAAVLGLYLAQLTRPQSVEQQLRSQDLKVWAIVLTAWPVVLFLVPTQDPLIELVGLRGSVFMLPFILFGARMTDRDVYGLSLWLALLNIAAFGCAAAEYVLGLDRFFPRNAVTEIIYRSRDLMNYTQYRIPGSFSSAHAYGGTMVATVPLLVGAWVQQHRGRWQGPLLACALLASLLGVFVAAARSHALVLFGLVMVATFSGRVNIANRFRWLIAIAAIGWIVAGEERLQRFTTLQDTEFISERVSGSVNMSLLQLAQQYPLGNGLGGGGTSVPYFMQNRIRSAAGMENEYARILLEQGVPGLVLWLGFLVWTFTRRNIKASHQWFLGRRLAWVASAAIFATGLLGVGLFTSIPQTALLLLMTGWFTVAPVENYRAAAATSAAPASGRTRMWEQQRLA